MRIRCLLMLLLLIVGAKALHADCFTPTAFRIRVEPRTKQVVPKKLRFRGGERACVIVMGDHDPVMSITVEVYELRSLESGKDGKPVARADSGRGDLVSVIWYPPRDEEYVIIVYTDGRVYNDCYISIK
jgi:hypothetical protein